VILDLAIFVEHRLVTDTWATMTTNSIAQ